MAILCAMACAIWFPHDANAAAVVSVRALIYMLTWVQVAVWEPACLCLRHIHVYLKRQCHSKVGGCGGPCGSVLVPHVGADDNDNGKPTITSIQCVHCAETASDILYRCHDVRDVCAACPMPGEWVVRLVDYSVGSDHEYSFMYWSAVTHGFASLPPPVYEWTSIQKMLAPGLQRVAVIEWATVRRFPRGTDTVAPPVFRVDLSKWAGPNGLFHSDVLSVPSELHETAERSAAVNRDTLHVLLHSLVPEESLQNCDWDDHTRYEFTLHLRFCGTQYISQGVTSPKDFTMEWLRSLVKNNLEYICDNTRAERPQT